MDVLKSSILSVLLSLFFAQTMLFGQNYIGVYKSEMGQPPLILQIDEKGELLTGSLYRSDGSRDEFIARIQKGGFVGVFISKHDTIQVRGVFEGKSLLTVEIGMTKNAFERVSKDFNYDFSRFLGGVSNDLREKVVGVWILKEQYKIENGQKVFTKMTGRDYMTALTPEGKFVIDLRGLRDVELEASKEIHIPQEYRPTASDYFEMSQMMSWKIVGSDLHMFPTKPIPGIPTKVYSVILDGDKMILEDRDVGLFDIYQRKN